jgi:hypothetical protein
MTGAPDESHFTTLRIGERSVQSLLFLKSKGDHGLYGERYFAFGRPPASGIGSVLPKLVRLPAAAHGVSALSA